MARMGCLLGVLLILAAVAALFAVVVLPVIPGVGDTPALMSLQGALFCPAGTTYGHERSSYSYRPGETYLALESYCVDAEGQQNPFSQEQEGQRFIISAAGFVVPFLIGLFLLIFSISRMTRAAPLALSGAMSVVGRPQASFQSLDLRGASPDQIRQMTGFDIQRTSDGVRVQMPGMEEPMVFNQGGTQPLVIGSAGSTSGDNRPSLTERLKQLEDARDQGLLSADEYEKLRKAILESL